MMVFKKFALGNEGSRKETAMGKSFSIIYNFYNLSCHCNRHIFNCYLTWFLYALK